MRRNILRITFIVMVALFTGYTVYSSQKDEAALSEVLLDNVEALASENWNGYSCSISLKCCGINDGITVSCTGTTSCEKMTDWAGYPCKGVICDGKETRC